MAWERQTVRFLYVHLSLKSCIHASTCGFISTACQSGSRFHSMHPWPQVVAPLKMLTCPYHHVCSSPGELFVSSSPFALPLQYRVTLLGFAGEALPKTATSGFDFTLSMCALLISVPWHPWTNLNCEGLSRPNSREGIGKAQ